MSATEELEHLLLDFEVRKEDQQYVSFCPQLGTATCGDSEEEALQNLRDAVWLHLISLEEEGELARLLEEKCIGRAIPASQAQQLETLTHNTSIADGANILWSSNNDFSNSANGNSY
ncbi:MAG: type II toxin-antitoxin system HicB family antitoxin [Candidatus Hydrogenedentes bacterium]|nr:type II toxin-antitoxin system HicB family antitoxin [Candidatus Hydrogenedentota bacterium]